MTTHPFEPRPRALPRRRDVALACCAGLLGVLPRAVRGQMPPGRTVRIVVPYGPGGTNDTTARIAASRLGAALGQTVIVENRPGGGGIVGAQWVARSKPDGTVLLVGNSAFVTNPSLTPLATYDPVKDFAAVARLTTYPLFMVGKKGGPGTIADVIAKAKANPGAMTYATPGIGTSNHVAAAFFCSLAGLQLTPIHYKSGSEAQMAVVTGDTDIEFGASVMPLVDAGQLRLMGVSYARRLSSLPDVPAVGEVVPGFEVTSWNGLFAPAGTPKPVVDQLNGAVRKSLDNQDVADAFRNVDLDLNLSAPEELDLLVRTELPRWARLLKQSGASTD